jgi:phosphatidylglycerol:prolipoprotein diacylglycerol transferase
LIPYLAQPRLTLAGHTFYAFGFLVAIALLAGAWMVERRAERFGLGRAKARRLTIHMLWAGFLGSHVLYLLLFQWADLARRPWRLLNPLDGIYSFGGIVCGLLTAAWLARSWRYLDVAAFVFPFSWTIARAGCALAHDHAGIPSASWIAVRFPSGPRLDLGLIEMLFTAGVAIAFLAFDRRSWPAPFYFGLWFFVYGPFRLWLDTLQVTPSAPDEAFGWGVFALGCAMLFLARQHRGEIALISGRLGAGARPAPPPGRRR